MSYNVQKLKDINPTLSQALHQQCFDIIGACMLVHSELGSFLNEYMYQEALDIVLTEKDIKHVKEYYFSVPFHGHILQHRHYVDFKCGDVFVECKAISSLGTEQRQQLWNYMRLTGNPIGLLYNFAPIIAQCERYYYDNSTQAMYTF